MMCKKLLKMFLFACLTMLVASCGAINKNKRIYVPVAQLEELTVEFVNLKWYKKVILEESTCNAADYAETPSLMISNIPVGTNAIIMEYSDKSLPLMDNGGHGKIGYALPDGTKEITISSIPSNDSELPNGFWLVAKHRNAFDFAKEYPTYMPPCSGGKGNEGLEHKYSVTIKAVYHAPSKNEESMLFAMEELYIGEY